MYNVDIAPYDCKMLIKGNKNYEQKFFKTYRFIIFKDLIW